MNIMKENNKLQNRGLPHLISGQSPAFAAGLAVLLMFLFSTSMTGAEEFRRITPIATPKKSVSFPKGARPVAVPVPVDSGIIESAIKDIMASWNTAALAGKLSENFYDKDRLLDAINTKVPRDAKLQILSIQGIQTLNQYTLADASGKESLFSTVSVIVRTQVEFNDPSKGFQRLEGTNEYILTVRQGVPK